MNKKSMLSNSRTKERIKKEFLIMYQKNPLAKIRISDLIKVCNISRGTFYFHFEDIYSLYNECERDMMDFLESGLAEIVLSSVGKKSQKMIEHITNDMKRYCGCREQLVLFLEGSEAASFRQKWLDSIAENFEKTLNFSTELSPERREELIRFYAGGHFALLSNWVLSGCKKPAEIIAAISVQMIGSLI